MNLSINVAAMAALLSNDTVPETLYKIIFMLIGWLRTFVDHPVRF